MKVSLVIFWVLSVTTLFATSAAIAACGEEFEEYEALLREASLEKLDELVGSEDDAQALGAAWERVRRTVPRNDHQISLRADALNRFLGVVEGRTGVAAPRPWERAVLVARSYGREMIVFPFEMKDDVRQDLYYRTEVGVDAPVGLRITEENGHWIFERDELTCAVSVEILGRPSIAGPAANAALRPDRSYVALHSERGIRYRLHCVATEDGELIWTAEVCAGVPGGLTGQGEHWTEIVVTDSAVIVFGITHDDGPYVEAFDAETGENRFRFNTHKFWRAVEDEEWLID